MEQYLSATDVARAVVNAYRTVENWAAQGYLEREKGKYGLISAIARIKNMKADLLEGKLINAKKVIETWRRAIAKTKAKFIALRAKLALELSGLDKPEDIRARLAIVINEALVELRDG